MERLVGSAASAGVLTPWICAVACGALLCAPSSTTAQPCFSIVRVRVALPGGAFDPASTVVTLESVGTAPAVQLSRSPSGGVAVFMFVVPGRYRALAVSSGYAPAQAQIEVSAEEDLRVDFLFTSAGAAAVIHRVSPTYAITFSDEQLRDLPSGDNAWSLIETVDPLTFADGIDAGGILTGVTRRLASHASSWTQTTFWDADRETTDLTRGGAPMIFPDLAAAQSLLIVSATQPVEVESPGVAVMVAPRAAGDRWQGSAAAGVSPHGWQTRTITEPPRIEALTSWAQVQGIVSGPLARGTTGLLLSATSVTSAHRERQSAQTLPGDLGSLLVRTATNVGKTDGLALDGSIQASTHAFDGRARFQDPTAREHDRPLALQASWHHRSKSPWWIDSGVHDSTVTIENASFVNGTIERLRDGPVPELVLPSPGNRRRWSIAAGMAPLLEQFTEGRNAVRLGAAVARARATSRPLGSGWIGETVGGIAARAWDFGYAGPSSDWGETTVSAYVSDRLAVSDRLTLDGGTRVDVVRGLARGARTGVRWTSVSPRVSASWSPSAAGQWRLLGSYGRYGFQLPLATLAYGDPSGPRGAVFRWIDRNHDNAVQPLEVGSLIAIAGPGSADGISSSIDPRITQPRADDYLLGVSRRFGVSWELRFAGLSRRERRLIADVDVGAPVSSYTVSLIPDPGLDLLGPQDDELLPVYDRVPASFGSDRYVLTNPKGLDAGFDGLELTLEGRLAQRLQVLVGATASRSHGAAGNRGALAIENDQGVIGELLTNPNAETFAQGRLFFERGYTIKASGIYHAPGDVAVAVVGRYQDGQNFARLVIAPDLAQGPEAVRAYPNGGSRFTYTLTVDAQAEKEFTWRGMRISARLDVFNLLNTAHEVEENPVTGPAFRTPTALQPPYVIRLSFSVRLKESVHKTINAGNWQGGSMDRPCCRYFL